MKETQNSTLNFFWRFDLHQSNETREIKDNDSFLFDFPSYFWGKKVIILKLESASLTFGFAGVFYSLQKFSRAGKGGAEIKILGLQRLLMSMKRRKFSHCSLLSKGKNSDGSTASRR